MRNTLITSFMLLLVSAIAPSHAAKSGSKCNIDSFPKYPELKINHVTEYTKWSKEAGLAPGMFAPHCKVHGTIGKHINFELLLPEKWNGKFAMGGGGGFVGSVVNVAASLYQALAKGYATVGTDTGHQAHSLDASWATNNLEAIVNFGGLAVHRTAVVSKALTETYYKKDIQRNLFIGCSRGGGQGMVAAQRYPEDFDGIAVGAPAQNWTMGMGALMTQIQQLMYPDPKELTEAVIGLEELKLIQDSYLAQCDGKEDGVKHGFLNDPRNCKFDITTLACKKGKHSSCLSKDQIAAMQRYYQGPVDHKGKSLWYGFPFGGEGDAVTGVGPMAAGGTKFIEDLDYQAGTASDFESPRVPNAQYPFATSFMSSMIYHDPEWSYKGFKFDTYRKDSAVVGQVLNSDNPDLSAFRAKGGKMLIYTGWSDPLVSPLATLGYYEKAVAFDKTVVDDLRLFMMPGAAHCLGGDGPSIVNFLDMVDQWLETDKAPDQAPAFWMDVKTMQLDGSRLICAYPKVPTYKGNGSIREFTSYECK